MFEMDKCREEFENLEDVKDILEDHKNIFLDSKTNMYSAKKEISENSVSYPSWEVTYLNGAYYAFQHQQAKVEEANAKAQMCRDEKNHAINRWSAVCKERDELQKRVDQQGLIIAKAMSIASDLQKSWSMFEIGKKLEQALKGGG